MSRLTRVAVVRGEVKHKTLDGVRYAIYGELELEHVSGETRSFSFLLADRIVSGAIVPGEFSALDKSTPGAYMSAVIAACRTELQQVVDAWDERLNRPEIGTTRSDVSHLQTEFSGEELGIT